MSLDLMSELRLCFVVVHHHHHHHRDDDDDMMIMRLLSLEAACFFAASSSVSIILQKVLYSTVQYCGASKIRTVFYCSINLF